MMRPRLPAELVFGDPAEVDAPGEYVQQLKADMDEASENLEYEKAATLRDRINSMHRLFEKQKAGFPDLNDKDVFAVYESGDEAVVQAMFVRKGELNHTERFFIKCAGESKENVLAHLLGTCRMGNDPATSVVDKYHRAHDVSNLFICDGSSFRALRVY